MVVFITVGAHRALPNVLAMERVFLHPSLVSANWLTISYEDGTKANLS